MLNLTFPDDAISPMKNIILCCLLSAIFHFTCPATARAQTVKTSDQKARLKTSVPMPSESFYFLMNDYKMEHQGEFNTLNIKVSYEYNAGIADQEYPDFIPIRKDVDAFLGKYPNETAFWEIVNKQLTAMILHKYPALASVTCEIQVTPSPKYSFTRGSIVTRHRTKLVKVTPAKQNVRREN